MRQDIHERQMELTMIRTERNRVKRRLEGVEVKLKDAIIQRNNLHEKLRF